MAASSGFIVFRHTGTLIADTFLAAMTNHFSLRYCYLGIDASGKVMATTLRSSGNESRHADSGAAIAAGTWYALTFIKSAAAAPRIWLGAVERTLTESLSGTGATADWCDDVASTPNSFSVAARITNEGTREYTNTCPVKVAAVGWTADVFADTVPAQIAGYYAENHGIVGT